MFSACRAHTEAGGAGQVCCISADLSVEDDVTRLTQANTAQRGSRAHKKGTHIVATKTKIGRELWCSQYTEQ